MKDFFAAFMLTGDGGGNANIRLSLRMKNSIHLRLGLHECISFPMCKLSIAALFKT